MTEQYGNSTKLTEQDDNLGGNDWTARDSTSQWLYNTDWTAQRQYNNLTGQCDGSVATQLYDSTALQLCSNTTVRLCST